MTELHLRSFERELSELCRRFRLGLTGATVFIMETEDCILEYSIDDQSRLTFGPEPREFLESDQNLALEASQEPSQLQYSLEHQ
jgi:hypothetical protein